MILAYLAVFVFVFALELVCRFTMAKKKEKKKGQGMEKTMEKTGKKFAKQHRDEEEDLDSILNDLKRTDSKRKAVEIVPCEHPSARCNGVLLSNPAKDELVLFGGEYYNGQKNFNFNDLFLYSISKGTWRLVKAPNPPSPRSSTQGVVLTQNNQSM